MNVSKVLILCFFLMFLAGCSNSPLPKINVSVENENIQIPAFLASALWNASATYGGAVELSIQYDNSPKEDSLQIDRWTIISNAEKRSKQDMIESNKIIAPEKAGVYVYSVYGKWSEGLVDYAFKVEVK